MFWNVLLDIVLILSICLLAGALLSRLGQSPLIGYLLAGVFLGGPGSLDLISAPREIETLAELGVSLLLFSLGLEFPWNKLKTLPLSSYLSGVLQVLCTLAVVAIAAGFLGLEFPAALTLGAMLSVSSTACVIRVLMERREIDSSQGRSSLGILLVQDMAVLPLALMVGFLASAESGSGPGLGRLLLMVSALIIGLYLFVNYIVIYLLNSFSVDSNREGAVLTAVVTGFGSTWAAHAVGISPAIGAFVAGMLLGSSPLATQIRADISSLRTVLLTLFFGTAGIVADPVWMLANWQLVLSLSGLIICGKALIIWLILYLLKASRKTSLMTALYLAQIGEFAFVLGSLGREGGLISENLYSLVVSCTIVSLFLTPFLMMLAPRLAGLFLSSGHHLTVPEGTPGRVASLVVVGFGPSARLALSQSGCPSESVLVIDLNRASSRLARSLGWASRIGDASMPDVLEHSGLESARVVAITIPDTRTALSVMGAVRLCAPQAVLIVRSRYQQDTERFKEAGADYVIGDEEQVGSRLGDVIAQVLKEKSA